MDADDDQNHRDFLTHSASLDPQARKDAAFRLYICAVRHGQMSVAKFRRLWPGATVPADAPWTT